MISRYKSDIVNQNISELQSFCKSYFGDHYVDRRNGKPYYETYGHMKPINSKWLNADWNRNKIKDWEYHLQQIVITENLNNYLNQHENG